MEGYKPVLYPDKRKTPMMDCHSLQLEELVRELAFGLDLDRNTFPLTDGNESKGQDKEKEKCATESPRAWNRMLSHPMG